MDPAEQRGAARAAARRRGGAGGGRHEPGEDAARAARQDRRDGRHRPPPGGRRTLRPGRAREPQLHRRRRPARDRQPAPDPRPRHALRRLARPPRRDARRRRPPGDRQGVRHVPGLGEGSARQPARRAGRGRSPGRPGRGRAPPRARAERRRVAPLVVPVSRPLRRPPLPGGRRPFRRGQRAWAGPEATTPDPCRCWARSRSTPSGAPPTRTASSTASRPPLPRGPGHRPRGRVRGVRGRRPFPGGVPPPPRPRGSASPRLGSCAWAIAWKSTASTSSSATPSRRRRCAPGPPAPSRTPRAA